MSGFEMINNMNYRVADDGMFTSIFKTDDEANDFSVYSTLHKAKQHAKKDLREQIDNLREAIQRINSLKDEDLEID